LCRFLTGKTSSTDDDHFAQNDCQIKLHTLMNFLGTRHLGLIPITITVFNNIGCTVHLGMYVKTVALLQNPTYSCMSHHVSLGPF
jgi:hypothetical protein